MKQKFHPFHASHISQSTLHLMHSMHCAVIVILPHISIVGMSALAKSLHFSCRGINNNYWSWKLRHASSRIDHFFMHRHSTKTAADDDWVAMCAAIFNDISLLLSESIDKKVPQRISL